MIGLLPPSLLEYTIHSCSSYSGHYGPENILVDNPTDQRSRWSGGNGWSNTNAPEPSNNTAPAAANGSVLTGASFKERQWIILKLARRSVLQSITFGKYSRSHPCNLREVKVFVGLTPDIKSMSLVYWGGLKNDSVAETFETTCRNEAGILLPCEYVCIQPIAAHSSNYNVSIWHVALGGNDNEEDVRKVYQDFEQARENRTNRLILKHLRQRGLLDAFQALQRSLASGPSAVQLEDPLLTRLHSHLVQSGDFDAAESLLAEIAYPHSQAGGTEQKINLLDAFCSQQQPRLEWTRLDTLSDTASLDGDSPSARGGHQLVLVRPPQKETATTSSEDIELSSAASASSEPGDDGAVLYLFGGWDGEHELADFWSFSLFHQRWTQISSNTGSGGNGPQARSCHQMAVDNKTGDIYLFGRFTDRTSDPAQNPPGSTTSSINASPAPSAESAAPTATEARQRDAIATTMQSPVPQLASQVQSALHNEHNNAPAPTFEIEDADCPKPDFWKYSTYGYNAGRWHRLSSDISRDGGPALLFDHQMVVDSDHRCLYVFGGKHYDSAGQASYSGLYRYNVDTEAWTCLSKDVDVTSVTYPTSPSIPSRIGHSMLLDSSRQQLLVLAGQRIDLYLSDMWAYDIEEGHWSCLERDSGALGGPDGSFTQRATLDTMRDQFVLLSGLTRDRAPPHHTNVRNAIWLRSLQKGAWQAVDKAHFNGSGHVPSSMDIDAEEPKPRFAHQFVYDPVRDEHYLFGGNPADPAVSARLGDFWRLRLLRTTKDEVLQRCKFLIRRCRFYEMCASGDSMNALLYLQTSLASVAIEADQSEFLACMSYLLVAKNGNGDSKAHPRPGALDGSSVTWRQRTSVFEALLSFFPEESREPREDLVSVSAAEVTTL